jgi:hypothetical protein
MRTERRRTDEARRFFEKHQADHVLWRAGKIGDPELSRRIAENFAAAEAAGLKEELAGLIVRDIREALAEARAKACKLLSGEWSMEQYARAIEQS